MMTKLNADGTPMPTKTDKTFEEALEDLRNLPEDPVLKAISDANGGKLTVADVVNSKDLPEDTKTAFLGALGIQYP